MLLCREKADYTLFNVKSLKAETIIIQEIQECIKNRGTLMSISKALEDAWEIWIKDFDGNVNVYMLFECGPMIIEI